MPLKAFLSGTWGVAAAVAVGHFAALEALSRLDGAAAPADPPLIQVEFSVPEPPSSDPGPVPDEGPSPLPEATPLPAAPAPESVKPPDPVVALSETAPADAPATSEVPPQGPVPAEPSGPSDASSSAGGGAGADQAPAGGEIAESTDYLTNPAPAYPLASRLLGEEGRVLVRVRVDTAGKARSVALHASSGHARLDGSALSAVRSWKFHPARRGGKPVEAWVIVPLRFSLKGA